MTADGFIVGLWRVTGTILEQLDAFDERLQPESNAIREVDDMVTRIYHDAERLRDKLREIHPDMN